MCIRDRVEGTTPPPPPVPPSPHPPPPPQKTKNTAPVSGIHITKNDFIQ
mgnify:CR=1 FL=1